MELNVTKTGQQSIKYLLSIPLEKMFTEPYIRLHTIMKRTRYYRSIQTTATQLQMPYNYMLISHYGLYCH